VLDRSAIADIITAFGEDDRLWTEELLTRLAELDANRYGEWSAENLSATLRPLGVTPGQIWRHGRNRNGYERRDIENALNNR